MSTEISPTSVSIRPFDPTSDLERCARLMATSEPWITLGRTYEASLALLRDPSKEKHVATHRSEFVGFLILNMSGAFIGYIQTICIVPEYRGRGMGTQLIRFAEERIFRESPNVFMCVSSFNLEAQKLYQRLGYTVIGDLKDYVVAGHSELLLRKSIGPIQTFQKRTRAET